MKPSITLFNRGEEQDPGAQQIRAIRGDKPPPPPVAPEETLLLLDKFSNMQLWKSILPFLLSRTHSEKTMILCICVGCEDTDSFLCV